MPMDENETVKELIDMVDEALSTDDLEEKKNLLLQMKDKVGE